MKRPLYLVQEALASLRVNRTSVMIGIVTTAFTISCFGIFSQGVEFKFRNLNSYVPDRPMCPKTSVRELGK